MTSTSSSSSHDVPFMVRDRRRKGFFTIDNELLDRFGSALGPYGLAVYMALARFANQESACWPSLATIAQRTGMSRRQVIREINKLQALGLIAVEPQLDRKTGEHKANRYVLLDTLGSDPQSPPSDTQTLPHSDHQSPPSDSPSPKQNTEKKTQHRNQTQRTTRARNDHDNTNTSDATPTNGGGAHSAILTGSVTTQPLKQDTSKRAHVDSSVAHIPPPSSDAPPSPVTERQQTGTSALIAVGMTARVAQRLAEHYSLERIEEKLDYLDFLQQYQSDTVKNPCGWLRKAIEDDFAAPDRYRSPKQQAEQLAATLALADLLLARPEPPQAEPLPEATDWSQVQAQYGTTDADRTLWQQTLCELETMGRAYICDLLTDTHILQCTDDTALIGVQEAFQLKQLQHPQTQIVIGRTLTAMAGHPLTPAFVCLASAREPDAVCLPQAREESQDHAL